MTKLKPIITMEQDYVLYNSELYNLKNNLLNSFQEKELRLRYNKAITNAYKQNIISSEVESSHHLPSFREWNSSEYSFNKNNTVFSATVDSLVNELTVSYFNLNPLVNGKKSSRIKRRSQRLSFNRILSSAPEIVQTNENTLVTLYVFNKSKKYSYLKLNNIREKAIYLSTIKAKYSTKEPKNYTGISVKNNIFNPKINHLLVNANRKVAKLNLKYGLNYIKLKTIKLKSKYFLKNITKHKHLFVKAFKFNNKYFNFYQNKYYDNYLKKLYKKEMLYLYYVKMASVDNVKYKNWFLLGLKNIISRIYKKEVEFNIVNMKYLHYNSNILTEAINIKLKNRNNRLLRVLKKAINMIRIPYIDPILYKNKKKVQDFNENNSLRAIIKNIKYKTVNGVRIEAAGRLSKRLTASRSVFKYKYKGSLKDTDSSYGGISSTISRGYMKQNVQFVKINSKTRNGAFGLKGWVSSF